MVNHKTHQLSNQLILFIMRPSFAGTILALASLGINVAQASSFGVDVTSFVETYEESIIDPDRHHFIEDAGKSRPCTEQNIRVRKSW